MSLWSRGSLGNEDMIKRVAGELRYGEGVRWGIKIRCRSSLGNEGMFKWATEECRYDQVGRWGKKI